MKIFINKLYKIYSKTKRENKELLAKLSENNKKESKSLSKNDFINLDELKIINNWGEDYYKTIKNTYDKIINFLNDKSRTNNENINTNKSDNINNFMIDPIIIEEFIL